MPWKCRHQGCDEFEGSDNLDSENLCPACGSPKTAWSLVVDKTRTLQISGRRKKLEARRGALVSTSAGAPYAHFGSSWRRTEEASVVPFSDARRLRDLKALPDPFDLLCVRMVPSKRLKQWELTVAIEFEKRPVEERRFTFEPQPEQLNADGYFSAYFLCVHGDEDTAALDFPFLHVLDVSDPTEIGHAPRLVLSGFKSKPVPVRLALRVPESALDCRRGALIETLAEAPLPHRGVSWHETERASVLRKPEARAIQDRRELPDAEDLIKVQISPEGHAEWSLEIAIQFASRPVEVVTLTFAPDPERCSEDGTFSIHLLCVHGSEPLEVSLPFVHTLDVTEPTALGHAPRIEVSGFGSGPIPIELGDEPRQGLLLGARLESCFGDDSTFPNRAALELLRDLLERLRDEPEGRLLVVGHSESGASPEQNDRIALDRAEAVRALVVGDAAYFEGRFSAEAWSWEEVQWLLAAANGVQDPCYVGYVDGHPGLATEAALGHFQLHRDLPVFYDLTEETLTALIQEYLARLGPERPAPDRIQVVSAGPHHPPRAFGSGQAPPDADEERVDLFLFSGPVDPPAESLGPGSSLYAAWCDAVEEELSSSERLPFPLRVRDVLGQPLADHEVTILDVDETPLAIAMTTGTGFAAMELEPGQYSARFQVGPHAHQVGFFLDPSSVGGLLVTLPYDLVRALDPPEPPSEPPPEILPPGTQPGSEPLQIMDFYVRPAAFDQRPERPVDLIVPAGTEVVLHWEVKEAGSIELEVLGADGSSGALPTGSEPQAHHTPQGSTSYILSATSVDGQVRLRRYVNVALTPPFSGAQAAQALDDDLMRVVPGG